MSEPGSMTTPQPMTQRRPLWRMPDGIVCSTHFSRPTTTVWPALLPPWKRTTTFTCGVMTSTTLPLPSSPHCVPTTTMLGMTVPPCGFSKMLLRALEHVGHRLRPRVGDRLLEPATDDIACDRGPPVAQPAGQRQRHGLLGREVDD